MNFDNFYSNKQIHKLHKPIILFTQENTSEMVSFNDSVFNKNNNNNLIQKKSSLVITESTKQYHYSLSRFHNSVNIRYDNPSNNKLHQEESKEYN